MAAPTQEGEVPSGTEIVGCKMKQISSICASPCTAKTSMRKAEHLGICLDREVSYAKTTGFERYEFEHTALPETNLSEIDTSTTFLGKRLALPFFVSAMTGGIPAAEHINKNLAGAAQESSIGMGIGSQRAMLEDAALTYTYYVRDVAPDILLLGNIGAVNLLHYGIDEIRRIVEALGADGLAVHLNPLHELAQPDGDTRWEGVTEALERLCSRVEFPVVAKEVGSGISAATAKALESAGVSCIDVAGCGGTCFVRVEHHRGSAIGREFFEWGIPTVESLIQCRKAVQIPVIASGGIRTGLECAKALALGADMVGFASPLLKPASESVKAVSETIAGFAWQLRAAMFLVGAKNTQDLRKANIICTSRV